MQYTLADIEKKVRQEIVNQLDCKEADVTSRTRLIEDLGCDSLDIVELVMAFEEVFDVNIEDTEWEQSDAKTVQDIIKFLAKKLPQQPTQSPAVSTEGTDSPEFTRVTLVGSWTSHRQRMVNGNQQEVIIPAEIGMSFQWGCKGVGYGEFSIAHKEDGQVEIKSETMGKEFVKAAVWHWLSEAVVVK